MLTNFITDNFSISGTFEHMISNNKKHPHNL